MTVSRTALVMTALVSAFAGAGIVYFGLRGASTGIADVSSPPVRDFALLDQDGRFHQLYRLTKAKAVVLYIHGLGCTTVRDSLPALKALRDTYAKQGVEFMLINANPQDDRKALQTEAARIQLDLPILKDEAQLVIQSLQAERTGEAILIDTKTWAIRYRGPIDDRVHYGSQRPAATRHYLNDALAAVLDKETVAVSQTPVFGCVLNIEPHRRPLSYAGDVVPILRDRCINCHRAGGVGPWAMDRYETVRAWSPMMREVIMTKRMPPWQADPAVGELLADRSLRTEEQKTLVRWIDGGAPRGDGPDPLAAQPPDGVKDWPLGEPDLVIKLPEQKLPAQGVLPYRWFKIQVPIDKNRWVRAVQLKPSNTAVMHHGFVLVLYPARHKDREPAWLEGRNGFFAAHVPGLDVRPMPEDSGQWLPAGSTLVFQLHYITVGAPASDRPVLGLYFHRAPPPREYAVASASNRDLRIPPFAANHIETAETTFRERVRLYGFYPHMHYRGRHFDYVAHFPDGRSERLLSVPNYSFGWQTLYRLKTPREIPAGTRIVARAEFDNSEQNPVNPDPAQEVRWGLDSDDEMLVGYLMYTRERQIYPRRLNDMASNAAGRRSVSHTNARSQSP